MSATMTAGLILSVASDGASLGARSSLFGSHIFLSANEARAIAPRGAHTMVNRALGIGIGVASVHGQLVTLLDLDPDHGQSEAKPGEHTSPAHQHLGVLCELESGEAVLITGTQVIATGLFQAVSGRDAVLCEGRVVDLLSVGKLYRKVETSIWERRALTIDARPPVSRRSEGRTS